MTLHEGFDLVEAKGLVDEFYALKASFFDALKPIGVGGDENHRDLTVVTPFSQAVDKIDTRFPRQA